MRLLILASLYASCLVAPALAEDSAATQYIVHLKLTQGSAGEPAKGTVLGEPTLLTSDGREASFRSGGALSLKGQEVDNVGTEVSLSVHALEDGKVRLHGKFFVSRAIRADDDVAAASGVRVHFDRATTLGRREKFTIQGPGHDTISLEVLVEDVRQSQP